MENKEKETFNYTYSAKEHDEIKAIRKKYMITEETEDKMAKLRRLDAAVTQKATIISLVFGIIGALIIGMGMSLIMTDIGEMLGYNTCIYCRNQYWHHRHHSCVPGISHLYWHS